MTDERSYPEGVPCWVDTEQPDVHAARHFYANLFGWTFSDAVPADAPGKYLIASLGGYSATALLISLLYLPALCVVPFMPETKGRPLPI